MTVYVELDEVDHGLKFDEDEENDDRSAVNPTDLSKLQKDITGNEPQAYMLDVTTVSTIPELNLIVDLVPGT